MNEDDSNAPRELSENGKISPIVDDSTGHPCFLYRGGDAASEVMVCGSQEIEDDWAKRGFVRAGHALPDTAKLPIPHETQVSSMTAMLDPSPKEMPPLPGTAAEPDAPPSLAVDEETHAVEGIKSGHDDDQHAADHYS